MPIINLFLTWLALVVFLYAGSLWLQGFIYNEPASQITWGAPAAGSLLTLLFVYWCWLDVRDPEKYDTLFRFSTAQSTRYDDIWVEREGQRIHYHRTLIPQGARPPQIVYKEVAPPNRVWSRSDSIIVKDKDQEVRFEAERDRDKNYKVPQGKALRYVEPRGRYMTEEMPGLVTTERWGTLFGNLTLNLVHFLLWFLTLWVLLRFQWSHALGLAASFWVIMTVLVVPGLLDKANDAGRKRQQDATQAQRPNPG